MANIPEVDLAFRRQYICGPDTTLFPNWNRTQLPDGNTLAAHPDLQITEHKGGHYHLFLLGYLLDPTDPGLDNLGVLQKIEQNAAGLNHLLAQLYDKSGHYVLFAYGGNRQIVLNDAGGLKQVYYHRDTGGRTWLTSHAAILADRLDLKVSPEAEHYIHSPKYKKKLEPWWPGDSSPYMGVSRLVPNHYLDLATHTQVRFWPLTRLQHYSLRKGTQLAAELLKGTCQAAFNRSPVALTLTGGYDSRVILAACRDFAQQIDVFSMIYRHLNEESEDLVIPKKIAETHQLKYQQIRCDEEIPADFIDLYQRSTAGYKTDWMNLVYGRYAHVPAEKVIFKGNIAEAVRCDFWPDGMYPVEVTVDTLVDASVLGDDPFVYQCMERWMKEALPTEKLGYKILDTFAWEIEAGSWQAMSHSIFGFAHEEFSPFGNRKLLDIMLGVPKRYRCWPDIAMEQEIIKYLWKDLAVFPYYSSWSMHGYKKKFYDGDLLNFLRKIRHRIKRLIK